MPHWAIAAFCSDVCLCACLRHLRTTRAGIAPGPRPIHPAERSWVRPRWGGLSHGRQDLLDRGLEDQSLPGHHPAVHQLDLDARHPLQGGRQTGGMLAGAASDRRTAGLLPSSSDTLLSGEEGEASPRQLCRRHAKRGPDADEAEGHVPAPPRGIHRCGESHALHLDPSIVTRLLARHVACRLPAPLRHDLRARHREDT